MKPPDWQSLIVSVNERSAIYVEHFPNAIRNADERLLMWFTDDQARHVLFTFAGAWPTLARDPSDRSTRYLYLSDGSFVCRFRGIELAPNTIVVAEMTML